MVSFRSLVAGVALIASPVMAALTLDQVTNGVRRLTAISDNIDINAGSINAVNAALILIGQGPFPAWTPLCPPFFFFSLHS